MADLATTSSPTIGTELSGGAMSTQRAEPPDRPRLPTREEVLAHGKPFPPYEEMIIEGLTDEEEEAFLKAIAEA